LATVKIKYSTTPFSTPSGLTTGELAVNIHERRVYIGSTGGSVDITGVRTFNGLTGDVTGVTTSVANTFTALQTFNSGISAAGGTFSALTRFTGGITTNTLHVSGGATFSGPNLVAFTTGITAGIVRSPAIVTNSISAPQQSGGQIDIATDGAQTVYIGDFYGNNETYTFIEVTDSFGDSRVVVSSVYGDVVIGDAYGNGNQTRMVLNDQNQTLDFYGSRFSINAGLSAAGATFGNDIGVNGVRVGRGGGNISSNTVLGSSALGANTTGTQNVAIGIQALNGATNAGGNIAIGRRALFTTTAGDNVGIGNNAATNLTSGSENVYIGSGVAANSGSSQNEIVIGANTTGRGSNTVTIGNSSVVTTFVSGVLNASSGISASGGITFGGTVASDTGYRITSNAINAQTGTTYTFLSTDNGKVVTFNNGSAVTVTIPSGLPVGFNCTGIQLGAGQVGFTAASGVTMNAYASAFKISGQHGAATVLSYTTNIFNVSGTLSV
jgi:hypothetical protein